MTTARKLRNLLVIFLVTFTLTLTGCAFLDSLLLEPLKNEDGKQLYMDVEAAEQGEIILVPEDEMLPGRAYEPQYKADASDAVGAVSGVAGLIPGWGTLVSAFIGLFTTGYAALRGRRRVNAEKAAKGAWESVARHGVHVLEAIKSHDWDADDDGKVSVEEVKAGIKLIIAKAGSQAKDPVFLADVVRALTGSFTPSEQQEILEDALKTSM